MRPRGGERISRVGDRPWQPVPRVTPGPILLSISARVRKAKPVYQHVGLSHDVYRLVVSDGAARGVLSIRHQYERLSALDVPQPIGKRVINRFINAGAIAGPRVFNRALQNVAVVGEVSQESDVPVERHNHDAVLRSQLSHKGDRGFMNIVEAVADAGTNVEQQRNVEWYFFISKERDFLLDSILIDFEVPLR